MKATPLLTLCALLGTLATCAHLPPADFDLSQTYGKWYTMGLATNAPWLTTHKASMKMLTTRVHPTANGDVNSTYSMPYGDSLSGLYSPDRTCWTSSHVIQQTGTPGQFKFHIHHSGQDYEFEVTVVDVMYGSYAMLHTRMTKPELSPPLCEFHSRSSEVSTELQERFRQFALKDGVKSDNIVFLPNDGEC